MILFKSKKKPSILQYRGKTLLSQKVMVPFTPLENNNVMVYGGSGTGKSHCFVIPNLMTKSASYVVADPGGDLYRQTASYMESSFGGKYRVLVLSLEDPYSSMHYNPFRYLENESDIHYFAHCLFNASGVGGKRKRSSDPFWDIMGEMLIEGIIYYLHSFSNDSRNLANVAELLSFFSDLGCGEDNVADRTLSRIIEQEKDSKRAIELLSFVNNNPDRTFSCICGSASSALSGFLTDDIKELTRLDELNLWHFTDEPTILYIIYDEVDPTKNALLNLLYMQLFKILYSTAKSSTESRLQNPVRFIIDDFANTDIPNFSEYLATCRKYNISICPILQSPNQLIGKYGREDAHTIQANCESQLFTGSSDLNEIHDIARLFLIPVEKVLSLKKFQFLSLSNKRVTISDAVRIEDFKEYSSILYEKERLFLPLSKYEPLFKPDFYNGDSIFWDPDTINQQQLDDQKRSDELQLEFKEDQQTRKPLKSKNRQSSRRDGDDYRDGCLSSILAEDVLYKAEANNTFDSKAEEVWYQKLSDLIAKYPDGHFLISCHQRLTDLFRFQDDFIPYFYTDKMHCDFTIHKGGRLLAGIEIDGPSHAEDEHQKLLDQYKDDIFKKAGVPLFRINLLDSEKSDDVFKKIADTIHSLVEANVPDNDREAATDSETIDSYVKSLEDDNSSNL